MSEKKLKIKLVHSTIGRDKRQAKIVKGLGLRKLQSERELVDTPEVRGMIAKVAHLVDVLEENIVAKKLKTPKTSESKTEVKDEA